LLEFEVLGRFLSLLDFVVFEKPSGIFFVENFSHQYRSLPHCMNAAVCPERVLGVNYGHRPRKQ
jgi:hypothetical protein